MMPTAESPAATASHAAAGAKRRCTMYANVAAHSIEVSSDPCPRAISPPTAIAAHARRDLHQTAACLACNRVSEARHPLRERGDKPHDHGDGLVRRHLVDRLTHGDEPEPDDDGRRHFQGHKAQHHRQDSRGAREKRDQAIEHG